MTAVDPVIDRADVIRRMRTARAQDLRRCAVVATTLVVLLVMVMTVSILAGSWNVIPLRDVPAALVGAGDPLGDFVVFSTLVPRTLGAAVAGLLFALSGILYQRTVRNALATPDVIGITAGASMGAVWVIVRTPAGGPGLQWAALAGALVTIAAVCLLSWRGELATYRLILVGIGTSAVAAAMTNYLLISANLTATAVAVRWTSGSTSNVAWPEVRLLLVVAAGSVVAVALLSRSLAGMRVGDDLARGLGVRVTVVRLATLAAGAAVAALTTSVTGPIAFVALVSGPIVTRLVPRGPHLLLAAIFGALLVSAADVVAQHGPLISPIPVGVVTAIVGAPVFLWLLLNRRDVTS